jgi:hypothetical protein
MLFLLLYYWTQAVSKLDTLYFLAEILVYHIERAFWLCVGASSQRKLTGTKHGFIPAKREAAINFRGRRMPRAS